MRAHNAGLLMYRYGERGLEIFLMRNEEGTEADWYIPYHPAGREQFDQAKAHFEAQTGIRPETEEFIELDHVECNESESAWLGWAFEAPDYEELPLQHLLGKTESPLKLRRRTKMWMDHGTYFCVKEAAKKVFPAQVALIKELQEILSSRNLVQYL